MFLEVENVLEAWVFSGYQLCPGGCSQPSPFAHPLSSWTRASWGFRHFCCPGACLRDPLWPSFQPQALTCQVLAQVGE